MPLLSRHPKNALAQFLGSIMTAAAIGAPAVALGSLAGTASAAPRLPQ